MADHSPLPWRTMDGYANALIRQGDSQHLIALIFHGDSMDANAAFICRAVNCHHELVDALALSQECLLRIPVTLRTPLECDCLTAIAQAIKSAEQKD